MEYIEYFIPLTIGLLGILFPDQLIPTRDATYEKKKATLKKSGFILIGVAFLMASIKFLS